MMENHIAINNCEESLTLICNSNGWNLFFLFMVDFHKNPPDFHSFAVIVSSNFQFSPLLIRIEREEKIETGNLKLLWKTLYTEF